MMDDLRRTVTEGEYPYRDYQPDCVSTFLNYNATYIITPPQRLQFELINIIRIKLQYFYIEEVDQPTKEERNNKERDED